MDGSPDRAATNGAVGRPRFAPHAAGNGNGNGNDLDASLTGVFNFRDLASAQRSGGPLRPRLIYRADGLNRCRTDETQVLADLGIRRVLDLRTDGERVADGIFEHPDIVTVHIPMTQSLEPLGDRLDSIGDWLMPEFYLSLAATNSGAIGLCIAEIIASAFDDEPLVVHSAAGKDRTGIVAAFALALVGVDDEAIADDYARSAAAIPRFTAWYRERRGTSHIDTLAAAAGFDERQQAQLLAATPDTMLRFLDGIRHHYGSIEEYLVWGGTDRGELDRALAALASTS